MDHKKVTIKIPEELYQNLRKLVDNTGFSSVTEFITFTLRGVATGDTLDAEGLSLEDIDKVRKRLKSLGYM